MDTLNIGVIKELLAKYQTGAKKSLGQNFLISEKALNKIIEAADIQPNEQILEIGPGLGTLTRRLAEKTTNLTAIELDDSLIPLLTETLPKHVQIIHKDALRYEPPENSYKLIANIPYYITSPIINHFLQRPNPPKSLTLLVQKEVAEKICQLDPDMSVLSLQVALFGTAKIITKVENTAFYPAPKVDSAVIQIEVTNPYPLQTALAILNLAKKAFTSKRKKLSNTLKSHREILEKLGLGDKRPEHLSIGDWEKILVS